MKIQNRQMVHALDNAIRKSEEWQQTQSIIDALQEKWRARREKSKAEWSEGERILRAHEAKYAPRWRRREERDHREQQRISNLRAFWFRRFGFRESDPRKNDCSIPRDARGVADLITPTRNGAPREYRQVGFIKEDGTKTLFPPIVNREMERLIACFMTHRMHGNGSEGGVTHHEEAICE